MTYQSDDLCMCGHNFGHHALEKFETADGFQMFTGRCAIGQPDWIMKPGTYNREPVLVNGKPVLNPKRCMCERFKPGRMVILPLEEGT